MEQLKRKQGRSSPTPARLAAFEVLLRVETESSFASELLGGPLVAKLDERDASLATEIVLGTLRWQATLDFIAQRYTRRWEALDAEVRVALRMGLYQLWFLCRVPGRMPARAALYETVEVVKTSGKRSAAGLVNAVLRKSLENDCALEAEGTDAVPACVARALAPMRSGSMPEIDWRAIEYSHPAWLLERWIAQMGQERVLDLASADNRPPATFLFMNQDASPGGIERELAAEHVELGPGKILTRSRTLRGGNVVRTKMFRRGEIAIQDEASQAVPLLLDVREGQRVLDLCAAPGNKTRQLAQATGAKGEVVACDIYLHRLAKMAGLQERTGQRGEKLSDVWSNAGNVRRVVLDGERELPFTRLFDRILVDAPCSGTGTLARHPEIKWRLRPEDIPSLAKKQLRLLHNAAAALAPGGRMVYSVCSIEEEEGREVARKFLAEQKDYRLLPLREDAARLRPLFLPEAAGLLQGDFFRTDPARDGVDGFFAAIFEKPRLQ
jgi:16S rRNA (cytosine967-C5)-methyltransferase